MLRAQNDYWRPEGLEEQLTVVALVAAEEHSGRPASSPGLQEFARDLQVC